MKVRLNRFGVLRLIGAAFLSFWPISSSLFLDSIRKRFQRVILLPAGLILVGTANAQPGSPECLKAQKAVNAAETNVDNWAAKRSDPTYAGPAITVWQMKDKLLKSILQGAQAAELIDCSAQASAVFNGYVKPKYVVLTVVYAPPGASTGSSGSSVEYSNGSSLGSTVSTTSSYKSDYDVSATVSGGFIATASVTMGVDWSETQTSKAEISIKQSSTKTISVPGPDQDGINHDFDEVYLWLNPIVNVRVQNHTLIYSLGVDPSSADPNSLDVTYLYAGELKNPALIKDDRAVRLAARGFTADDYKTILTVDPFATGTTQIDPKRFVQTSQTLPYVPPFDAKGKPSTNAVELTSENMFSNENTDETTFSMSLSIKLAVGADNIGFALANDDKWTWTDSNTATRMSGTTQSAKATIGGPAFGYTGVTDIAVFRDTLFNSFLFAPNPISSLIVKGTIRDSSNQPISNQQVTLKYPGRIVRTYTDSTGNYHFSGANNRGLLSGAVSVGNVTKAVKLGAAPVTLNIQMVGTQPAKKDPQ